jgi:hypothetical protein
MLGHVRSAQTTKNVIMRNLFKLIAELRFVVKIGAVKRSGIGKAA